MSCLVLYMLKKTQQTQPSDTFLKVCEPDFFCLEVHSPAPVLVQVRPVLLLLKFKENWSRLEKNIAKSSTKNDTPCKQLRAILFSLSNVEMFQQCTILIIHKIKLLPHVVLNAVPHLHPLPSYPQLFVGRRNVTTVQPGWGTRPTAKCPSYSDSSEKHKKLCPKALH